jgi:hypothetical protein
MRKTLTVSIFATLCSVMLTFIFCCGLPDGILKRDSFAYIDTSNSSNSIILAQQCALMKQLVAASEDTISEWAGYGTVLCFLSLLLNIALLFFICRHIKTNQQPNQKETKP